jgi:hypothetical protein
MKDELETTRDVGTPRWLVAVASCTAVFLVAACCPAGAASPEDCREFHQECTDARAAGYRDVGICNVERLECPTDDDLRVPKPSHEAPNQERPDPERSFGERSIGP